MNKFFWIVIVVVACAVVGLLLYPGSQEPPVAIKEQPVIVVPELRTEMQGQIGRILLVLNGYQSMMGRMPTSVADLDNGEYFFDSDYLAEVVPAGYTTYLLLAAGEAPRIWPVRADKDEVYVSIDSQGSLQKMSKAEALQEIEAGYAKVATKGAMVFLQKK